MTVSGPIFIIGALLAVAGVLQILRRWTGLMAWTSLAVAAGMSTLIALVPLDGAIILGPVTVVIGAPFEILGRVLVIEAVDRLPIMFVGYTAAMLFLIAWRLLPHSNFFPTGLAAVAMLVSAQMVRQVVYAALLVEMAALLTLFPLHEPTTERGGGRRSGRARGGVQYLVYATLALPGLMITQLLLEQYAISPSDVGLLETATVLLGLSLAILLGAVPFQSWLSTVAMDGSPPVVTFLFTVNIGTVWFLLLAYLESYRWLSEQASFGILFTTVGLLMMVIGGALAASQRRLGRMVGYATLVDNGAMFVALGAGQISGLALTIMILMARPLALGLMTLGLDGLRHLGEGDDRIESLTGAAWAAPWRTLAFMVGGIALAGFPLSLGFAARWGLYRLVAGNNLLQAIGALLGSAGVMMGLVSTVRELLAPMKPRQRFAAVVEDPIVLVLILLLIAGTLFLGVFPQLASQLALQTAEAFTFYTN